MLSWLFPAPPKTPASPSVPDGMRVYAIGDIHGRPDLLDELYDKIARHLAANPRDEAVVVLLGDYVDRGPDSKGVLDRLCASAPAGLRQVLLKGNHEDMMLKFMEAPARGNEWRSYGGGEALQSYGIASRDNMPARELYDLAKEFRARVPLEHLKLLTVLPTSFEIGDYFFCHAGVRPGMPLDRQGEQDLLWIREKFLQSEKDFGKMVVHGHSPVAAPEFHSNRIAIDTNAYESGRLTCLVLDGTARDIIATG